MPDRVVYLVTKVTKALQAGALEFVDDTDLARILEQGFEISTTIPGHKVRAGDKSVTATMMVLKPAAENRGMSVRGQEPRQVRVADEFGGDQQMDVTGALAHVMQKIERGLSTLGGASHLGGAGDRILPGMRIISGEKVGQAYDLGTNAAMTGQDVRTCPFPPSSEAAQLWLSGFRSAGGAGQQSVTQEAAQNAFRQGHRIAQLLAADDEVTCPFPQGSPLRKHWLEGFRSGGGRVEG